VKSIIFEHVYKSYQHDEYVIKDVNLTINQGEFVTILGPSGCGKTTLLKMVNKLVDFDRGRIEVNNTNLKDWDTIKLRRSIGYVIQQVGLFPHMTVKDNINYVLSISEKKSNLSNNRASELIELVGLSQDYLARYPRELSGGQKQRIGVARALAANPEIILMDEPFGAVDEISRTKLQDEILNIHSKLKKTILFVTHDIQEAIKLGSKIVLMNQGEVSQVGTSDELVFKPSSDFVKNFLGLKGFQAILSEEVISRLYDEIFNKNMTLNEFYLKISSTLK
jgi:osmoprotectant transport system ATP-binding protein